VAQQDLYFSAHTHSRFSSQDALTDIPLMVARAARFKQPAVGLTDHGNMSGTVELYRAGQKHGLKVFPGFEGYLVDDINNNKADRYHIGFLSLTLPGYQLLSEFISATHSRPAFNRFPRHDLSMLAELADDRRVKDIAVTTGCYFGLVQQTLVLKGYQAAKRIAAMYAKWFPNLFMEIQNHNIVHDESGKSSVEFETDADICDAMVRMADELGLPLVATQDSHYLDEKDKPAHSTMKRIVYKNGDANEFPGDPFHFASTWWVQDHHNPEHWEKAQEGFGELLDLHDLTIPPLDKFKTQIPTVSRTPKRDLRRGVMEGLVRLENLGLMKKPRKRYEDRINHELDIINHLGMAGYFTVWIEIVEWCRKKKIAIEARGSANGSLVCYLIGITSVDPVEADLLFERFLSKDRKGAPDVDMDVEDIYRKEIIEFIKGRFGVTQIGTFSQLGARNDDDKGSVLVSYNAYLRQKMGIPAFNSRFGPGGVQTIGAVRHINMRDHDGLRQLSRHNVSKAYGVHASGLLLNGDRQKVSEYVPTMLVASSNTSVTQMTGDDVEQLGYLKLDILGQRTLRAMKNCQEMILQGCADGIYDQDEIGIPDDPSIFNWIPLNDSKACAEIRKGRMDTGIFQFEGYTMARGGRELGVKSTNDFILANALYRTACIDSGMTALYIQRRRNPELRKEIEYPHPAFEEVLRSTYGVVVYQEQVLEIMRRLGLDYEGINIFFKAVKDSGKGAEGRNRERFAEVKKQWASICVDNGIDDPEAAWHYIEGYTSYGFNKSHSAGYGLRGYRAQWLKTYFPLEYMAASLASVSHEPKKEAKYIAETRTMGIRLLSPDVNVSGVRWTLDRRKKAIRKGLMSVKGIGINAAQEIEEAAPFTVLEDMISRISARTLSGARKYQKTGEWSGNLKLLREAGALSSFGIGRYDNE
jgi:DNA polymerase-3 subunit alpha